VIIIAKKKPIKKEVKEEQPKPQKGEVNSVDCFIPSHFVDWNYFGSNIRAILDEIPIRKFFVGCNNPTKGYIDDLESSLSKHDKIEFIDQRGIKTLGMQIVDLMKRCQTDYFVFLHADARPTRHSFLVLKADMFTKDENDDRPVGIVESDRIQYAYEDPNDFPTEYPHYYYRERSFSGYQLFRKEAIKNFLEIAEDDYIYRNEDIIFQNVCEENGYRYVKSFGLHIHTCSNINHKWTPQGIELPYNEAHRITMEMQVKGIIKYCTPTKLAVNAWRDAFGIYCAQNNINIFEYRDQIKEKYPKWAEAIEQSITELLRYFVWK